MAAMLYPTIAEPDQVVEWAQTMMWETHGPVNRGGGPFGAWLRAWPSGHVHYSRDWCARLDGRFDTACGRVPVYWPQDEWRKAKICPVCEVVFRGLASGELRDQP